MLGGERSRKPADKCMRSVCVHRGDGGCCGWSPEGNRERRGLQAAAPRLREAGNHGMRELALARALPSAFGGKAGAWGERLQMAPPLSHHSTMTPLFSVSSTSIRGCGFPHSCPLRPSPCN